MLNIYYFNCCGIDVHKRMLVATIAKTDEHKVTTYQTKQFSTLTKDIEHLKQWLINNDCKDVCMESTGKYWIPIFNIVTLLSLIQNMLELFLVRKLTKKILFGLLIFLNMDL